MDLLLAGTICIGIVAFGELISYVTKAVLPSLSVSLIVYLLLVWAGMPKVFPDESGISALGTLLMTMLIVDIGASVSPRDYVKNWRSVLVALGGVIGGAVLTIGVGGLIFGFGKILTGAGAALGGGAMAGIVAVQWLQDGGFAVLVVLPLLMISAVDPLGQPIATQVLRRYVKKLTGSDAYLSDKLQTAVEDPKLTKDGVAYGSPDNPSPFIRNFIPKSMETEGVLLFELAILSLAAGWLEGVTGISSMLIAFIFGILGCTFGFLRMNVLENAKSYGLLMTLFIAFLFPGMNDVTPQLLLSGLAPMLAIVILSAVGLGLGAGIVGKLMKYNATMSAACGIAIMFLFPGALLIPRGLASRLSRNDEERKYLFDKIMPTMFIVVNAGLVFGLMLTLLVFLPIAIGIL
ncbi:MAG: hypothetical protein LBG60_02685 [Bifidobacteriaceae bacterium]|jgi:hypothetical protein|nr:hypothetical protein [Bifidobacteriaceae bacterium]